MSIQLQPMSETDYTAWLSILVPEYAQEKIASGAWPAAEALPRSLASITELLPDGLATAGQYLRLLRDESAAITVGYLWFGQKDSHAYLYDFYVYPAHRRRGHGRQALRMLDRAAADLGFTSIALHVFGQNEAAAALYRSEGYLVTDLNMRKVL